MKTLTWHHDHRNRTLTLRPSDVPGGHSPHELCQEIRSNGAYLEVDSVEPPAFWAVACETGLVMLALATTKRPLDIPSLRSLTASRSLPQLQSRLLESLNQTVAPFQLTVFREPNNPVSWEWDGSQLEEIIGDTTALKYDNRPHQDLPALRIGFAEQRITMAYLSGRPHDHHAEIVRTSSPEAAPGNDPPDSVPDISFDGRQICQEKAPRLYRRLPAAIWPIIQRISHQGHINTRLKSLEALPCRAFPEAVIRELGVTARRPAVNLPDPGERVIFACNHPQGGLDGLIMLAWLLRWYPGIRVPVNDILMGFHHLRPFLTPINKYQNNRDTARLLHEAFASDDTILLFPAGTTARYQAGVLQDFPWGKTVAKMARSHNRPIVPVFLGTRNSRRFYTLAAIRRALGLGLNLEMLFLVDEMMGKAPRHNRFLTGEKISAAQLREMAQSDRLRALKLRDICQQLAKRLPQRLTPSLPGERHNA